MTRSTRSGTMPGTPSPSTTRCSAWPKSPWDATGPPGPPACWGAVDGICASSGLVLYIPVERDRLLAQVRRVLDPDRFAAAWAEGRAMSAEEAAGSALDLSEAGGPEAGG